MKLLVVIPAYNEEATIACLLNQVLSVDLERLGIEKQIVVVDDGSLDTTAQIVKRDFPQVSLIKNPYRQGKGSAIRKALSCFQADCLLIQDADLEYDPKVYPYLLKPILQEKAEVVYGSRFLYKKYPEGMQFLNYVGNHLGNWIVNFLYGTKITDLMTGYKVFSWPAIKSIFLYRRGFDICAEITAKLLKKKFKIYEVAIPYQGRSRCQGKKILLKDAFFILWALCEYRFC